MAAFDILAIFHGAIDFNNHSEWISAVDAFSLSFCTFDHMHGGPRQMENDKLYCEELSKVERNEMEQEIAAATNHTHSEDVRYRNIE